MEVVSKAKSARGRVADSEVLHLVYFLSFHLPGRISVIVGGRDAGTQGRVVSAVTLPRAGYSNGQGYIGNTQVN